MIKLLLTTLLLTITASPAMAETVYDRVMKTNVLKCGYLVYDPEIIIDPNTKELSGWVHDIIEAAAKELEWKVEWTEEVTFDSMFEGLYAGRYDAVCSGLWESPKRSKRALFMTPVTYATYYPYVRVDDQRFDNNLNAINSPDIKIAILDGEYGEVVANEQFPQAKQHRLAPGTSYNLVFPDVAQKKADVVFALPSVAQKYIDQNPNKLKMINKEVLVMPSSVMSTHIGEQSFKNLMDSTLRHLLNTGAIQKIIDDNHHADDKTNYPVSKPYKASR